MHAEKISNSKTPDLKIASSKKPKLKKLNEPGVKDSMVKFVGTLKRDHDEGGSLKPLRYKFEQEREEKRKSLKNEGGTLKSLRNKFGDERKTSKSPQEVEKEVKAIEKRALQEAIKEKGMSPEQAEKEVARIKKGILDELREEKKAKLEAEKLRKSIEEGEVMEINESDIVSEEAKGEIDSKFDFSGPEIPGEFEEPTSPAPVTAPFSALERRFFKEGEKMNEGTYKKGEITTEYDRADAFGKALESLPAQKLEELKYKTEKVAIDTIIRDIDARHKMAPESFPISGKEIVKKFNELKYMEVEIGRAAGRINDLLSQADVRKKKSGFLGKLFGRKKSYLEPDELEEMEKLTLDYKGGLKQYKEMHKEYEKIFKPLRDLAESGNVMFIAPSQLADMNKMPRMTL